MRHLKKGRKFGKETGPRKAFMKVLVSNLVLKGRVETTEARAKEMRPAVERLVSIGKKQNLAALRLLISRVASKAVAEKIYHEISPKYKDRNGGYTRIIKTAKARRRDGVRIAIIEFV